MSSTTTNTVNTAAQTAVAAQNQSAANSAAPSGAAAAAPTPAPAAAIPAIATGPASAAMAASAKPVAAEKTLEHEIARARNSVIATFFSNVAEELASSGVYLKEEVAHIMSIIKKHI